MPRILLCLSRIFGGHVLQIHTFLAAVGGKFWAAAEFVVDSGRISASCLPALGFLSGFLANHRFLKLLAGFGGAGSDWKGLSNSGLQVPSSCPI